MAIWRKILSTDKNNAGKFAKNLPRCDITHKYKAMAQEIELKFIVNHDAVDALRNHLHTLGGEHHAPSQLLNIYFERLITGYAAMIWGCVFVVKWAL